MKTVTINREGRLTLPIESRRALGIEGETELEIEVDPEHDVVHLRPVIVLRREDAWAYTAEHRALLREAHADAREGRVRSLDEDELAALGD
jgi:bifunctional DNA-binding transcriptional regulator/antitoxin component of YhaV-PrlF toxin-antitoxin module